MTDQQHPLTDETIKEMTYKTWGTPDHGCLVFSSDDMRAAYDLGADQQLEQVKKKVEIKLSEWRRWPLESCDDIEDFFYYVMQELRPLEGS